MSREEERIVEALCLSLHSLLAVETMAVRWSVVTMLVSGFLLDDFPADQRRERLDDMASLTRDNLDAYEATFNDDDRRV